MPYSLTVQTRQEFEDLILSKPYILSKSIVDVILDNLNTTQRFVNVLEVFVEDEEIVLDITADRENFIDTLEINLKTIEGYEDYESCTSIKKAIEDLTDKRYDK